CAYLFLWLSFGFGYHAMFQYDPSQFKVNAPIVDVKMFEAIQEHKTSEENIREAQRILGLTLGGLRSEQGRTLLFTLSGRLRGEARSIYKACLSLAIVGPPSPESAEEVEFWER